MIWTNTIAFNMAMLVFFEWSPIHMLNQIRATRLAAIVRVVASEMGRVSHATATVVVLTNLPPPVALVVVKVLPPVVIVVTVETVALLGVVASAVTGGGGAPATARFHMFWYMCALNNCAARKSASGAVNIRSNARHWPCTIWCAPSGVASRSSINPLCRASTWKWQGRETIARDKCSVPAPPKKVPRRHHPQ